MMKLAAPHPHRRFIGTLTLMLLLGILLATFVTRPGQAHFPTAAEQMKIAPIAALLNPDGTIKPGLNGSFDPNGYRMELTATGAPRFMPMQGGCGPSDWDPQFTMPLSVAGGMNEQINGLAVIGNSLYVGGGFTHIGSLNANYVAKFDLMTNTWSALQQGNGNGVGATVNALAVMGTNLYVGGEFTRANASGTGLTPEITANFVAKFDTLTNTWSALRQGNGNGVNNGVIKAAVMNNNLYIAGGFTQVNSGGIGATPQISANRVAKFDTATNTWSALTGSGGGNGVNSTVLALALTGCDVFVGGLFTAADNKVSQHIARYGPLNTQAASLNVTITDPFACTAPGDALIVTAPVTNPNNSAQTVSFTATLPAQLLGLSGTCILSPNVGNCTVNASSVTWSGTLAANQTVTTSYQVQVADGTPNGMQLCINSTATITGAATAMFQACTTLNCPGVGPGQPPPAATALSDQKPGSVLFYNLYTSNPADLTRQNTRINLTNTDPARSVAVHLFFVDGATCTPADSYVCLTPNQTVSLLGSDIDPGTTGYIVAVASDPVTGCPINFNFLIGDAFVKLSSGHTANLAAESFAALTGTPPVCSASALTATLNFDGMMYNQVPRVLAVDNFPSTADGNNTLVILNRVGGDLRNGASTIGALFGLLFDESEQALSFTLASNACQFRFPLTNASLRTTQRLETVIGPGHTGWLRLWGVNDIGLLGSVINLNATAGVNNFNQGHNLHKLTFTSASLTIPILPPACQ